MRPLRSHPSSRLCRRQMPWLATMFVTRRLALDDLGVVQNLIMQGVHQTSDAHQTPLTGYESLHDAVSVPDCAFPDQASVGVTLAMRPHPTRLALPSSRRCGDDRITAFGARFDDLEHAGTVQDATVVVNAICIDADTIRTEELPYLNLPVPIIPHLTHRNHTIPGFRPHPSFPCQSL
jgi:hypothetical protein